MPGGMFSGREVVGELRSWSLLEERAVSLVSCELTCDPDVEGQGATYFPPK